MFDYVAAGLTLGTAGAMTEGNSWEYVLFEFDAATSEVVNISTSLKFAGNTLTAQM